MRPHRKIVLNILKNHFQVDQPLIGAEIGVQHGMLASMLLERFWNLTLAMVDPWQAAAKGSPWADTRDSSARARQSKHEDNRRIAYERTEPYRTQRLVMEWSSQQALAWVPDKLLDFVFIDGDHSKPGCLTDMGWFKKLRDGGLFMGHDYSPEKTGPPWYFGVVPVVDNFCDEMGLDLHVEEHAVWWAVKT